MVVTGALIDPAARVQTALVGEPGALEVELCCVSISAGFAAAATTALFVSAADVAA
jgi:hypothetical protein